MPGNPVEHEESGATTPEMTVIAVLARHYHPIKRHILTFEISQQQTNEFFADARFFQPWKGNGGTLVPESVNSYYC